MIKRIELKNFMSHEHTVIEPAPGLTVLVGPNNCGKSAVVAALQILCHNENSTYVLRHGERECSVKVETDDGHVIEWRRKNSPSYLIDGTLFDRLGRGSVPEELHPVLRMPLVDKSGDADFDVHFGSQKSPIFLLGSSPTNAARFFASSSDAIQLVQIQKRHKDRLTERQRQKNDLEAESKQLNSDLESLQPVPDLQRRLISSEELHQDLQQELQLLDELEKTRLHLASQQADTTRLQTRAHAFAPLASPPELAPSEPLERQIDRLLRAQNATARSNLEVNAFVALAAPPEWFDVAALAVAADKLAAHQQTIAKNQQRLQSLRSLAPVPTLTDPAPLTACVGNITVQNLVATESRNRLKALEILKPVPKLADIEALAGLLPEMSRAQKKLAVASSRHFALTVLSQPPPLVDESALGALIAALSAIETQLIRFQQSVIAASVLHDPPVMDDTTAAENLLKELIAAAARRDGCQSAAAEITSELASVVEQVREFAETATCPTCGGSLNAEQLLAGSIPGNKEHSHD